MLYLESVAGTISPEDTAFLKQQLAADMLAKKFWEQLEQEGNIMALPVFINSINPQNEQKSLKEMMAARLQKRTTRYRRIQRMVATAAAIMVLFAAAWFFMAKNKKVTDTQTIASLVRENRSSVSLKLGSGETVDLKSQADRKIAVGNTILDMDPKSLHFSSADTSVNLLTIPQGENYTLTLSDGTVVTLNAETKLKFPFRFGAATRDVYLDGEAYFKVAKDSKHPFIVHTPLTKVEVAGTEFNINTYAKSTVSTVLVEGKVLTEAPGGGPRIPLQPGHAAIYNVQKGFNVEAIDTDDVVAWTRGVYYFHDLPFYELAEKMTRVYGVPVKADNPALAGRSVSGIMDRNNLPELLQDLKATVGIDFYYTGKVLHIQ
ncbi:FecR family protein [Niabella ginsenosidivorans]|nr:FecR domain-containing protein [Niabella ginsenosidivorans]